MHRRRFFGLVGGAVAAAVGAAAVPPAQSIRLVQFGKPGTLRHKTIGLVDKLMLRPSKTDTTLREYGVDAAAIRGYDPNKNQRLGCDKDGLFWDNYTVAAGGIVKV